MLVESDGTSFVDLDGWGEGFGGEEVFVCC